MAIFAVAKGTIKTGAMEAVTKHSAGKKPIPDQPRAACVVLTMKKVTSVLKFRTARWVTETGARL